MAILITGGAGFIGSNLVDRILSDGWQGGYPDVHVWDNLSSGSIKNVHPAAFFKEKDLSRIVPKDYIDTTIKFEVVFHMAAMSRIQPSFDDPIYTHHQNLTATINALELARTHRARFVYAGSSSFYHDVYAQPYTFTKWVGEEYCRLYNRVFNVPVAIARFFNVYGPNQICDGAYATVIGVFERQKKLGEALTVTGTGEQRRDFTHVDDIVDGLIAMSHKDWNAEIFNLGTGKNYSINEVAQLFEPKEIKYLPARPGEADITLADIEFSQKELGYEPKIDLSNYVTTSVNTK